MAKPPLGLSVVSIAADGSEQTWWSGDKYAYNRPQQLSFRNRIGEGFSDGGTTLARRVDRDYNDLELYNDIVVVGDDGQIPYEGRIGATPRTTSGGHSISVQTTGHMAHAKDQKFREPYVDRDLSAWGSASRARQAQILGASRAYTNPQNTSDTFNAAPGVRTGLTEPWPADSESSAWYDAGPGCTVGQVYYSWETYVLSTADASWLWAVYVYENDDLSGTSENTGNLRTGVSGFFTPGTPRRYAAVRLNNSVANTGTTGREFGLFWKSLAVYGGHGLPRRGPDPGGLYASDVITNIAQRFCPKLNTAGVEATDLVIPHIVFKDRTTPFDAFLLLNGPHGYELAVWENKTLYFRPYDLSDYDWQVRMDQPGVDLSLQGDTTEELANYAVVEFDNVATGQRDQVSPSDDSSLEDTTVDHPATRHGLDVELTVGLTFPTTKEVAIAFGQSYLNEFNRPKNRGQITVQGHILDRAGHWIQPWMVRAGQTISVVDHPNDSPRLITEAAYDHPSRTVTISTDNGELNQLEAVVDYIKTSLTAGNLA